ncbi:MAG: PAS domain S-box protein [Cryobacterium sp.]|nr:PAS domain S-box protein [Oligoflexia bacterium]
MDALVVNSADGEKVFTLTNADLPYRILVEFMNEGALKVSSEGIILYGNSKFAEMVGLPLTAVIGRTLNKFLHPADLGKFEQSFKLALGSNAKCALQLNSNGAVLHSLFSMSSANLEGGKGVCLLATDMTEQMRFDQAKADVEALQIEKDLRDRFVSTLSHDLRSPQTAIKTSAQIIVRYPDQREKHQVLGNRIIHSVERADKMIHNLLDANLIRAGEKLP